MAAAGTTKDNEAPFVSKSASNKQNYKQQQQHNGHQRQQSNVLAVGTGKMPVTSQDRR